MGLPYYRIQNPEKLFEAIIFDILQNWYSTFIEGQNFESLDKDFSSWNHNCNDFQVKIFT